MAPLRTLYSVALLWGCGAAGTIENGDSGADAPGGPSVDALPFGDSTPSFGDAPRSGDAPGLTPPVCAGQGGGASTQAPVLLRSFTGVDEESWLASPAVADLDGDGAYEIIVARHSRLVVWRPDGTVKWQTTPGTGRIWASPVVGDFVGDGRLEVVVASRAAIVMYDAAGQVVPGWPRTWRDEVRALAAGDVDGDGRPEVVAVTTTPLDSGGQRDIIEAFHGNGDVVAGYPPNTQGTSGCDDRCYVTGGYDQTLAVGRIDGDQRWDILAPQDNSYMSWHQGSGVAYDANAIFQDRTKVLGIRFLLDYGEAQMGWAPDEQTSLQAHFTNSAPAIADIQGDGNNDIVVLSSVQNVAQTDRKKGTALWLLHPDGTRLAGWEAPFYLPEYLAGLEDFGATNVVAETQQVTVVDLLPDVPGLEMVFAAFDGRIHVVGADKQERWSYRFTDAADVVTGGVLVADLSRDGVPEIVFATYSPTAGRSALFILDARGQLQQRIDLPGRGAMAVPTIADVDRDGRLDIVVSLKDAGVLVYSVPGSAAGCMPWPTGRGNLLRNGFVPGR